MIDIYGNYYKPTILKGEQNFPWKDWGNKNQVLSKGDYIPIFELIRNYWYSDFSDVYPPRNGWMSATDTSKMVTGFPLFISDEYENAGHTWVNALVVIFYAPFSSTGISLADRTANGDNLSNLNVTIKLVVKTVQTDTGPFINPEVTIDLKKFVYTIGAYYHWERNSEIPANISDYNCYILPNNIGYPDPFYSGVAPLKTQLFPIVIQDFTYSQTDPNILFYLATAFYNKRSDFDPAPYKGFDAIQVGDDSNYWIGFDVNYLCFFGDQRPNEEHPDVLSFDHYNSGYEPPEPVPDYPFEDDYNGGGGGTGDYRDTSDTVAYDGLPTRSALSSEFVQAYNPSAQEMISLHNYLMGGSFIDNVSKLISDPIDYIISLMLAPYTPVTGNRKALYIGGTDSGVTALPITNGYAELDCGTIELKEFWGKYYDYNPYTKIQIYLPFIGIQPLDVDDCMSGIIGVKYRIDVLTGACVATVSVNNTRGTNGALYYYNGNCHSHIPVSGKNYLETIGSVLSASAPLGESIAQGNPLGIATGAINVLKSGKDIIKHSGNISSVHGLLGNYKPFLIVSRPSQSLAENFKHYKGYVTNVTAQLGTLTGYTEIAELVQTNIHCTLDEFEEINTLLKEGVYL